MNFLSYFEYKKFQSFVLGIKGSLQDWQLVEISLTGKTAHNAAYIAWKVRDYLGNKDGIIFVCNSKEILVVANMGKDADVQVLSDNIENNLPQYSCTANATPVTVDGLTKVQIRLEGISQEKKARPAESDSPLVKARKERKENIIMIVDDDMFIRSVLAGKFKAKGQVVEVGGIKPALEKYLEILPDVLFLDIHLPDGSGIDALAEILKFDEDAYVIIMSSDSVKDNVISARNLGAKGFVTKTFAAEKLEDFYNKCPTIKRA